MAAGVGGGGEGRGGAEERVKEEEEEEATHSEVDAEDVWVAARHLQDAGDTLTEQLRRVHVLQDGLQVAHHQLEHKNDIFFGMEF